MVAEPDAELAPFRRTSAFWNWLPAFRAVAEWGGVLRAARALRTSASGLSRSVRLLEEGCGQALFVRQGRVLVLTKAGEALLGVTRLAMRSVHDATTGDREPSGVLRIAASSRLAVVRLLPALSRLRRLHRAILPSLVTLAFPETASALLSGRIDAAVTLARVDHPDLESTALAPAENSVFCGRTHPLFKTPRAPARRVVTYPFAAPEPDTASDGWPTRLPRTVALRASVIDVGIDACTRGELLAVLPVEIVAMMAPAARLRALSAIAIPKTDLFAVRRRPLRDHRTSADLLVSILLHEPGDQPA